MTTSTTLLSPGRFHLVLASAGRPVQHGWWDSEATARHKCTGWIGSYGSIPTARITLTDEQARTVLTSWPEEP